MSNTSIRAPQQSDTLLWLAGAIVVGMGVTWLIIANPWSNGVATIDTTTASSVPAFSSVSIQQTRAAATSSRSASDHSSAEQAGIESFLESDPLRLARLAREAGMLVEPEDYSAWALYQKALQHDPSSSEARQGLDMIAAELVARADVALEQGRFDDVRATIERIRSAIPVHTGANDLAIRLSKLAPREPPRQAEVDDEPQAEEPAIQNAASTSAQPAKPAEPDVGRLQKPYEAFLAALEDNRILAPADAGAKHFFYVLSALDAQHELTQQAEGRFLAELLARAERALDATDTEAAATWIREAELLTPEDPAIARVRDRMRGQLISIESSRRRPASDFTIVHYTPPVYPSRAQTLGLSGWVDLEFTVARDGSTHDVVVIDASHRTHFRTEAVEAAQAWRFEPHLFLGEPIEQRAYTRIRFEFQ